MDKKLPFKKAGSGPAKKNSSGESPKPAEPMAPESRSGGKAAEANGAFKKGPVKGGSVGAKTKARAKAKAAAAAKPKRERKAAPVRTRGGIPFICSECYEEFVLPATYARETVTCPECLHVGKRPADNFLEKVNLHKTAEKRALAKSLIFSEMLLVGALVFIWFLTPYAESMVKDASLRGNITMGFGGLVVVLIGLLAWSIAQYEKNRWEIYF